VDQKACPKGLLVGLICVEEVCGGVTALEVQFAVCVEEAIGGNLQLTEAFAGQETVLDGRKVLIRPWRTTGEARVLGATDVCQSDAKRNTKEGEG
jgi:hypothetical protein